MTEADAFEEKADQQNQDAASTHEDCRGKSEEVNALKKIPYENLSQ